MEAKTLEIIREFKSLHWCPEPDPDEWLTARSFRWATAQIAKRFYDFESEEIFTGAGEKDKANGN